MPKILPRSITPYSGVKHKCTAGSLTLQRGLCLETVRSTVSDHFGDLHRLTTLLDVLYCIEYVGINCNHVRPSMGTVHSTGVTLVNRYTTLVGCYPARKMDA